MSACAARLIVSSACLSLLVLPLVADIAIAADVGHVEATEIGRRAPATTSGPMLDTWLDCDSGPDDVELLIDFRPGHDDGRPGGSDEIVELEICIDYPPDTFAVGCKDTDGDGTPDDISFWTRPGFAIETACGSAVVEDLECALRLSITSPTWGEWIGEGRVASLLLTNVSHETKSTVQVSLAKSWAHDSLGDRVPVMSVEQELSIDDCCRGDCNGDRQVDLSDVSRTLVELADGDDASVCDDGDALAADGRACCDCNTDRRVDVADAVCVVLEADNAVCARGQPSSAPKSAATGAPLKALAAPTGPGLAFGRTVPAAAGQRTVMELGIHGRAGGHDPELLQSARFCIDFDDRNLEFDPADGDGDRVPDAISFSPAVRQYTTVDVDLQRSDCELQIATLATPPEGLSPGGFAQIEFTIVDYPTATILPVSCGGATLTFAGPTGAVRAGSCSSGSFALAGGTVRGPGLAFGQDVPAFAGQLAEMPLSFAQGEDDGEDGGPDDTTAFALCVDFDPAELAFDPTDGNNDGIPDAVIFYLDPQFTPGVQVNPARPDCELILTVVDLAPPLALLPNDVVAGIQFTLRASAPDRVIVQCGDPSVLSFSDTLGESLQGTCTAGSFQVVECRDEDCDDGQFCNGVETCDTDGTCKPGEPPVCDDGVACTVDTCDPDANGGAGECVAAPDDTVCDDGQFCNGAETCDPVNDCQAGEPPVCDDGVACTVDTCDPDANGGAGECVAAPDDTVCDDGQFCNGVETCDPVNDCQAGEPPVCDDGVACTVDTCDPDANGGAGECVAAPDDTVCDDGQFCNGVETCDPVDDCQAGEPPVCDDGVACTVDTCDPDANGGAGECVAAPDDTVCDDGQFCNGAETCDPVNDCQAGEPPVCDDGVDCTVDSCDPDANGGAGECIANPDDMDCDDGQFCNGAETCDPVNDCQAGEPPVCDDGVACTVDTCDPEANGGAGECAANPDDTVCDDGQFCNGAETCDPVNDCQAGEPPVCDDGVACTVDSCDPEANGGAGECAANPDDTVCDDGQFCNGVETCDPVNDCQAGEPPVCDDGVACTVDTCDPDANGGAGECVANPDDTVCDDGQFCNGAETCDPVNDCQAGEPPVCDDGVACTVDSCDPEANGGAGECAANPDDTVCDDGQFCNGAETCDPVNDCQAGEPPVCDDGVACTVDSCDPEANGGAGECAANPDDTVCDDGQFCNGLETCDPVNDCQAGEPPVCDDGVACTVDSCDPDANGGAGECAATPDDTVCDDGQFCNGLETCDPVNDCQAGEPPVCDDGVACTVDSCDPDANGGAGECAANPDDTVCDDGQFCNGAETCDPVNDCQAGEPPVCDDGVACTVDSCDPDANGGAGECAATPDDTVCDDGQFCNGLETCDPVNDCQAGEPPVCDDGIECTRDSCDPDANDGAGECVFEPDDAACDDGQFCNGLETCDPNGNCLPGEPPICDDGVTCTVDACDPAANEGAGGCVFSPDDADCDDGQFCNGAEVCDPSNDCQSGTPPICDDGIECTIDTCDPAAEGGTGDCAFLPDDSACDDGMDCSIDTCDPDFGCRNSICPGEGDDDDDDDDDVPGGDDDDDDDDDVPGGDDDDDDDDDYGTAVRARWEFPDPPRGRGSSNKAATLHDALLREQLAGGRK